MGPGLLDEGDENDAVGPGLLDEDDENVDSGRGLLDEGDENLKELVVGLTKDEGS